MLSLPIYYLKWAHHGITMGLGGWSPHGATHDATSDGCRETRNRNCHRWISDKISKSCWSRINDDLFDIIWWWIKTHQLLLVYWWYIWWWSWYILSPTTSCVLLIQEFPQFHDAGSDDSPALHADSHALHALPALPALPEPPEAPQDEAGASYGTVMPRIY